MTGPIVDDDDDDDDDDIERSNALSSDGKRIDATRPATPQTISEKLSEAMESLSRYEGIRIVSPPLIPLPSPFVIRPPPPRR
jgi:hypothetical protein